MKKGSGGSFWIKRVKDKRKAMEKQEKRNFNGKKYRGKQTDSNMGKKSGEMKSLYRNRSLYVRYLKNAVAVSFWMCLTKSR